MRATVITDASFSQGYGGWAAWVTLDSGLRVKGAGAIQVRPLSCSNEAEIYAALNGIWLAVNRGAHRVLLRSDSKVTCDLVEGKGAERFRDIWNKARAEYFPHTQMESRWVRGHTNDPASANWVNRWCDKHAVSARKKAARGQVWQKIW